MKLILLGAPGAGKGTQSALLSRRLNIPAISTGNILRNAMKDGSELGREAKSFVDSGKLVPDQLIISIVHSRLEQPDCANGYILDGVPRTIVQAEALEKAGILFDHVFSLDVSDEAIIARLSGRRVCESCGASYHITNAPTAQEGVCDACGGKVSRRKDDAEEIVRGRLEVYRQETKPLIDFYAGRGILWTIEDNGGSIEETLNRILAILEAK